MTDFIKCEVCGQMTHPRPDGQLRCDMHRPEEDAPKPEKKAARKKDI